MRKLSLTLSLSFISTIALCQIARTDSISARFTKEPLYVLDGTVIAHNDVALKINALDPGLIETISVLKDSTAVNRFGERARNGAVVIETKKGKKKNHR